MTKAEHIEHHKRLHTNLDELLADFITHTGKIPSKTTFMELLAWSSEQCDNPTEIEE